MIDRLKRLKDAHPFVSRIAMLGSATVAGQALLIAVLPILTRLFSPSEFGQLGVVQMSILFGGVVACLSFDTAIGAAHNESSAANLVWISVFSAFLVSAVALALILVLPNVEWGASPLAGLGLLKLAIPLGILCVGIYSALQMWSMRKDRVRDVAITQLTRSTAGSAAQIGFGFAGFGSSGLIGGYLVMLGSGIVPFLRRCLTMDFEVLRNVSKTSLKQTAHKYRSFPFITLPSQLIDSATANLPLLVVAQLAGSAKAGILFLALRITSIPLAVIGGTFSRLFLNEARKKAETGEFKSFTIEIARNLARIGFPLFLALGLLSWKVFPFIFGRDWEEAGFVVLILAASSYLQFVVNPISGSLIILQKYTIQLYNQIFGFVCIFSGFIFYFFFENIEIFIVFGFSNLIYYIVYLGVVLFCVKKYEAVNLSSDAKVLGA